MHLKKLDGPRSLIDLGLTLIYVGGINVMKFELKDAICVLWDVDDSITLKKSLSINWIKSQE